MPEYKYKVIYCDKCYFEQNLLLYERLIRFQTMYMYMYNVQNMVK